MTEQLLPSLSTAERDALRAEIAEHGVRVPIDVDEEGNILDGNHRQAIADELGMDCPTRTITGLDETAKRQYGLAVNSNRRGKLPAKDRRELAASLYRGGMSQQVVALALGVSQELISADIRDIISSDNVSPTSEDTQPQPEPEPERKDTRGRKASPGRPKGSGKKVQPLDMSNSFTDERPTRYKDHYAGRCPDA